MTGGKKYRLEDDLLKKTIPKFGSKRYNRLRDALFASGTPSIMVRCERCKMMLFNPHSILLHQGGFCRKRIENAPEITLDQIAELLQKLNLK